MSGPTEQRILIENCITKALRLIPGSRPKDLPPTKLSPDVPGWHDFEHSLWRIGEDIRQILNNVNSLRGDQQIYSQLISIVGHRAAKRGRQSFVLLFGYKSCSQWAKDLARLLPDEDINLHIVSVLNKMKERGFSKVIKPLTSSENTALRNEAKRYINFDTVSASEKVPST